MLQNKSFKKLLFSVVLIVAERALAAACCGGGFALPTLITGDDAAMVTTSISYSKVDTDVTSDGVWIKKTNDDLTSKTFKIDAVQIFADRYQAGVSIPFQTRNKTGLAKEESSGLSDVVAVIGYEYLPDWDYNPWRPHGVGFMSITLPTGKSIQDSQTLSGIDSRGRGFWAIGLGTALTKSWTKWDSNLTFEGHKSFQKSLHTEQGDGVLNPGLGGSIGAGIGYNIKDLRLGTIFSWNYEDAVRFESDLPSDGAVERFATAGVLVSYVFQKEWAGTLSYSDQTVLGSPTRTTLSKTIAVSIQRRWAR